MRYRESISGGFTFIELLVTLAIVAVLATIAFPMAELTKQRERERELKSALQEIRSALSAYKRAGDEGQIPRRANESGYPPTLQVLVDGVENVKDPARSRIYFLRSIPRDPTFPDQAAQASAMWGKRSYASPPDKPLEGKDVFDVYSRSPATGLNGVPYREW